MIAHDDGPLEGALRLTYRRLPVRISRFNLLALVGALISLNFQVYAEEAPPVRLRAAVVLDASMSMNTQDPGQLAIVAARLLVDLATPRDEISLITFGTQARSISRSLRGTDATRATMYAALNSSERDEWCTDYRVGIRRALDMLGSESSPGERRLIIFLTDGLFDPDRSNESYYSDDAGRELLEKARGQKAFTERPCARSYKRLIPHVERGFLTQMDSLVNELSSSGIRLYTVGLGSDLGFSSADAARSRALLERLAVSTGGAFLAATSGDQLPGFFASIYSALVGAPVESPRQAAPTAKTIDFEILRGAKRVAVVADAAGDRELELTVLGPGGKAPQFEVRSFNVDTAEANGYRLLSFKAPRPGQYQLSRRQGVAALKIQVIQEVGLRLAIEGLPAVAPAGVHPTAKVALRSSAGEPVKLSSEFLSNIEATFGFGTVGKAPLPKRVQLDRSAQVSCPCPQLGPGEYEAVASASHRLGLLDVAPVTTKVRVLHQLEIEFAPSTLSFDVMAEEDLVLAKGVTLGLAEGSMLPVEQEFIADWSSLTSSDLVDYGPERFTLGPDVPSVPVKFELRNPRINRSTRTQFKAKVIVRPVKTELFRGEPRWSPLTVDGNLRPWDWRRYYQEYRWYLWNSVAAFFILFWLVGRVVASKWGKKTKLHYVDLEDPSGMETAIRLKKRSRSHLPFRSDRHRCGRGGTPGKRGKKKYCDVIAAGRGFRVVPLDEAVTYTKNDQEIATRKPIKGRWDQRYKLGERYEIWLTRT